MPFGSQLYFFSQIPFQHCQILVLAGWQRLAGASGCLDGCPSTPCPVIAELSLRKSKSIKLPSTIAPHMNDVTHSSNVWLRRLQEGGKAGESPAASHYRGSDVLGVFLANLWYTFVFFSFLHQLYQLSHLISAPQRLTLTVTWNLIRKPLFNVFQSQIKRLRIAIKCVSLLYMSR